ncbi:hypothetical protein [Paenibacillus sp. L3-i20]|uniref:hypothetical protein n=1 Tax=Paenibacillus sp. L3-i20 TaxID=2905833 RepID=UPI001EDD69F1|nr:hypothetical protein [Paenibacillus sp. L3-i20]GKU76842.1 hypothetical protein L3i20_v212390 [Paenibacillus sp. L3-i20]
MRKPIQYPMQQYQPLTGMIPPITIRDFKGVNTLDPFSIPDNMFTDMMNFTTSDYPTLSVRPGYTQLGSTVGTKVLGLGACKDKEIHAVFNDGTWRKWNGSSWVQLANNLDTSADWSFTNFQGNLTDINLIGTNGVNGLRRYDGTSVQSFGNAPANLNYVTTYQNRLWGASGKELRASALDRPDLWNTFAGNEEDSYAKDIESSRGENINMLSGGLTKLIVGMPNAIKELYGGLPSDFNDRLITEDEGFSNNKSAVTHEGIMRFIHKIGLFTFTGGVLPDKSFSDIVSRYFSQTSNESVSGTDGTRIYFNLPPDTLLVYDPRSHVQSWSVWKGIKVTQFLMFQNELYIGDSQGRVLRLGGSNDAGLPINWSATTKPYTSETVAQKMRWLKMWTHWELDTGSTLNVYLSDTANGDDWELVQTVVGTGRKIERILIPVNKFTLSNMIRIKFEGYGWARLHELTRKFRLLPLK